MGAATASLLTNLVDKTDPNETASELEAKRNIIVNLVSGIASQIDIDPATATNAATASTDNNFAGVDDAALLVAAGAAIIGGVGAAKVAVEDKNIIKKISRFFKEGLFGGKEEEFCYNSEQTKGNSKSKADLSREASGGVKSGGALPPDDGDNGGRNKGSDKNTVESQNNRKSDNQMRMEVRKGKSPRNIDRVDKENLRIDGSVKDKTHVHFKDGSALNKDGTWKHGFRELTNAEKSWLRKFYWRIPGE